MNNALPLAASLATVKPRYIEPRCNEIRAITREMCFPNYFPIQITRNPANTSLVRSYWLSHPNLAVTGEDSYVITTIFGRCDVWRVECVKCVIIYIYLWW